jgi:hypothetical protein
MYLLEQNKYIKILVITNAVKSGGIVLGINIVTSVLAFLTGPEIGN